MVTLVRKLFRQRSGVDEDILLGLGLRNVLYDAYALGVVARSQEHRITLAVTASTVTDAVSEVKRLIRCQQSVLFVERTLASDPKISGAALGVGLRDHFRADWKPASAARYATGLRGYLEWSKLSV